MFALLVACNLGTPISSTTVAALLDEWASRFERCQIEYLFEPLARSSLTQPFSHKTRLRLTVYDDEVELSDLDSGRIVGLCANGEAWEWIGGGTTPYIRFRSTALAGQINGVRGRSSGHLRAFGAIPSGNMRWTEIVSHSSCFARRYGDTLLLTIGGMPGYVPSARLEASYDLRLRQPLRVSTSSERSRIDYLIDPATRSQVITGWLTAEGHPPVKFAKWKMITHVVLANRPAIVAPRNLQVQDELLGDELFVGDSSLDIAELDRLSRVALRGASAKGHPRLRRADCGIQCLYVLARLMSVNPAQLQTLTSKNEFASLLDIKKLASDLGLRGQIVKSSGQAVPRMPFVASVMPSHFIVVIRRTSGGFLVFDPGTGVEQVSPEAFYAAWTGYALEVAE